MYLDTKAVQTDSLRQRFTSLMKLVDLTTRFPDLGGALEGLVGVYRQFSQDYFDYFDQHELQNPSALNSALGRLQQEWPNISRACEQRQIAEFKQYLVGGYTTDPRESADSQALAYYNRFRGWKPAPVPIVFFGKLSAIMRYPFTPYALISIPFECYDQPEKWQALAHELGHQIFWNSLPLDRFEELHDNQRTAIINKLTGLAPQDYGDYLIRQTLVTIWLQWFEEVVADICGTLLAGPIFFQTAVHRAREAEALNTDDFGHPSPYIRPLICLETLKWVFAHENIRGPVDTFVKRVADLQAEGDAMPHPRHNDIQMKQVAALTADVVHTILDGQWLDYKAEPTTFGALFDCSAWLNHLPDVETRPVLDSLPKVAPVSVDRAAFTNLKGHLEKRIKAAQNLRTGKKLEAAVFDALKSLDLGQEKAFYEGWGHYYVSYYTTNLNLVDLYTVSK